MTPQCFTKQIEFIKDLKYKVEPLEKVVQDFFLNPSSNNRPLLNRTVSLTFDDGYHNFYTTAFPILKRVRFPATVFVITQWIGKKGYLSSDQLKEMEQGGIVLGSHGCTHRYLPELSFSQAKEEIDHSKRTLEDLLRHPIHFFCYPFGGFSQAIVEFVRQAGYTAAVTTNRSLPNRPQDSYTIRRIRMSATTHPLHLWAKCSGYYDSLRRPRPCQ